MKQTKWFDRTFDFNHDQNILPSIIERLRGTPVRLKEKLQTIPHELLSHQHNFAWSIKENIGHLTDLEPLWQGRLEDILMGEHELRAADLENWKTHTSNHNQVSQEGLLQSFRKARMQTVAMIETLGKEDLYKTSLHPRLKNPMRMMDLFLFVAEHDDHHLATITSLDKILRKQWLAQS